MALCVVFMWCINFLKGPEVKPITPLNCKGKEADKYVPSFCDYSGDRSDFCDMKGDIRIHGTSSSVFFIGPKNDGDLQHDEIIVRIRPYPRKFDPPLLERIGEVKITSSTKPRHPHICAINHTIPAVVFSNGGFLGNYYHDFTDILIPLFITSHQFKGEVHFLITNMSPWARIRGCGSGQLAKGSGFRQNCQLLRCDDRCVWCRSDKLNFLPDNAVFVQIAPLGKPSAREDFGVAALDRKLKYIHYDINVDESTLLDTYPRNDPVFTDPDSIHRQGYAVSFFTYLVKQNMKINVTRFRPVLAQALELIRK
ncbi:hypothetical protein LUZ60_009852 [Juncus effusus]|nr:hypothetical protein LUZ60_009852 [Juncus effusus]